MDQQLAGFWSRLGANILDALIFLPLYLIFTFLNMPEDTLERTMNILEVLYSLIIPVAWMGYTLGKKAVGVRIVRIDGHKITIWTTLKRYLLSAIVYGITLGIAIIVSAFMVALRKDKRSIHDFIAGTKVIRG